MMIQSNLVRYLRIVIFVVLCAHHAIGAKTTGESQVDRTAAANVFSNAGKKAGLEIWRVEVSKA